jgi:hypothetical protein
LWITASILAKTKSTNSWLLQIFPCKLQKMKVIPPIYVYTTYMLFEVREQSVPQRLLAQHTGVAQQD